MAVIDVLVGRQNKFLDWFAHQRLGLQAKQGGGGQVGFQNDLGVTDREVAHGRMVVQVKVARAGQFEFKLGTPQFFVLCL